MNLIYSCISLYTDDTNPHVFMPGSTTCAQQYVLTCEPNFHLYFLNMRMQGVYLHVDKHTPGCSQMAAICTQARTPASQATNIVFLPGRLLVQGLPLQAVESMLFGGRGDKTEDVREVCRPDGPFLPPPPLAGVLFPQGTKSLCRGCFHLYALQMLKITKRMTTHSAGGT